MGWGILAMVNFLMVVLGNVAVVMVVVIVVVVLVGGQTKKLLEPDFQRTPT